MLWLTKHDLGIVLSQSYCLESVLDVTGSKMYGCEVIATLNCDKQCVLLIIEPKKCDLDMIGTEKVFL